MSDVTNIRRNSASFDHFYFIYRRLLARIALSVQQMNASRFARLSSLVVERLSRKQKIVGSNPTWALFSNDFADVIGISIDNNEQ